VVGWYDTNTGNIKDAVSQNANKQVTLREEYDMKKETIAEGTALSTKLQRARAQRLAAAESELGLLDQENKLLEKEIVDLGKELATLEARYIKELGDRYNKIKDAVSQLQSKRAQNDNDDDDDSTTSSDACAALASGTGTCSTGAGIKILQSKIVKLSKAATKRKDINKYPVECGKYIDSHGGAVKAQNDIGSTFTLDDVAPNVHSYDDTLLELTAELKKLEEEGGNAWGNLKEKLERKRKELEQLCKSIKGLDFAKIEAVGTKYDEEQVTHTALFVGDDISKFGKKYDSERTKLQMLVKVFTTDLVQNKDYPDFRKDLAALEVLKEKHARDVRADQEKYNADAKIVSIDAVKAKQTATNAANQLVEDFKSEHDVTIKLIGPGFQPK